MHIYNKLVRDYIPHIIQSQGLVCSFHVLNDHEFLMELRRKLREELHEFDEAKTKTKKAEELADLLEIIYTLGDLYGFNEDALNQVRTEKAQERGKFTKKIYLEYVDDA